MTTVLVFHNCNGTTKTTTLTAPIAPTQMVDGGILVALHDAPGGPPIGWAMFTAGGVVALSGAAVEQYAPMQKAVNGGG